MDEAEAIEEVKQWNEGDIFWEGQKSEFTVQLVDYCAGLFRGTGSTVEEAVEDALEDLPENVEEI